MNDVNENVCDWKGKLEPVCPAVYEEVWSYSSPSWWCWCWWRKHKDSVLTF